MNRYDKILNLDKISGNQYTGAAGITGREAIQLYEIWKKLNKLAYKNNLYIRHRADLEMSMDAIRKVLKESGRLK